MIGLEIENEGAFLVVYTEGLDTVIEITDIDNAEYAAMALTWVEAQQLHRWLGERLGQ